MLSPRALVRGNPARAMFAAENSFAKTDLLIRKAATEHRYTNWQKSSFVLHLIIHHYRHQLINTLRPGDATWRHRTGSISTHLMAFA